MPTPETSNLIQRAIYWDKSTPGNDGQPRVVSPIEIECRLEQVTVNSLAPDGSVVTSDSLAYVDRELTVGGIFRLGKIVNLPSTPDKLFEIEDYNELPDIKGNVNLRWVSLRKFNRALPTVV